MSKAMSKVIGGHNLRATVVMAPIVVLLLLAALALTVPPTPTAISSSFPEACGCYHNNAKDASTSDLTNDPLSLRDAVVMAHR